MGTNRKAEPIQQIRKLFGIRSGGVRREEHKTRGGTRITLFLDRETYNMFQDLKIVILKKRNGRMSLDEKATTIDSSMIKKVRQIIAEANRLLNGGGPCGNPA